MRAAGRVYRRRDHAAGRGRRVVPTDGRVDRRVLPRSEAGYGDGNALNFNKFQILRPRPCKMDAQGL